ncbi:MAG: efflux RND transporter periplasmic adaptor subunit, partial [Calditrichaeota bacterium]
MGMDLIPVYEDEASLGSGGTIRIDPITVQNMGVRYGTVQRMDFSRIIRTVGKIEYNEDKLYEVSTKISGWIEKLYVNYTGELVKKGQPLLEIYSPELVTTQEEYLLALKTQRMLSESSFETIREGGESLLESARKRLLYWDIPPSEIERLEKTGEVKKTVLMVSPANGMVVEKNVVDGSFVKEGAKLFVVVDLSSVWVHASIYDYEVPWVKAGQDAEMELTYLPGKIFHGRVAYVYPYLREKARDVHVRLEFENPHLELKPGMYVTVRIHTQPIPDALVIPSEAVIRSGERNIVFVVREPGKFEPREIRIGEEGGPGNRYVRVLSGLLEGEQVVVSAQFLLDSESRLQEAIQKMLEERKLQRQE